MENSVSFSRQVLANGWRPAALILTSLAFGASAQAQQAPRIWLQEAKPQSATFKASGREAAPVSARAGSTSAQRNAAAMLLASGQAQPLSMLKGDFDQDGIEDLAVGYRTPLGGALALFRGNLDAFAPQSKSSWLAIGAGRFPSPFLSEAKVIELPEAPDFLVAGNFSGSGHLDIAAGARGSRTLYILAADGQGGFLPPQAFALSGAVTALGAAQLDPATLLSHIVTGTTAQTGSQLTVFENTSQGITAIATIPVRGPVTSLAFGNLSGDRFSDFAMVAAGELLIVHGRDVHSARVGAGPSSLQPETVLIPSAAASVTLGSFIQDRASRQQMAVLATDGTLHIVARAHLDTRPWRLAEMQLRRRAQLNRKPDPLAIPVDPAEGWQVAESIPAVASAARPTQPAILFRTQISSHPADDVMILDSAQAQMHVLAHESMPAAGAAAGGLPASLHSTMAIGQSQGVVAAIPMRVNIDGRPGVVLLKQGQMAPAVMMPLPDPTFFPNRFDDPTPTSPIASACNNVSNADISTSCSLREAILKANSVAGTDTIMLLAGTYTLGLPRVANDFSGLHGTLEVTDSLNIIGTVDGSGNPTSIVQGGTNLATSVDKVFSFNEDIAAFTNASVSISNLVIQNGHNRGDETIQDGLGGAFDFDTGNIPATATLTVTNCNITTNTLTEGEGGGFALFNTNNGTGFATITNSTIQNNTVAPSSPNGVAGNGGGIFVGTPATMVMNNSKVLNNSAVANAGINPVAGGLEIIGPSGNAGQNAIHGSTISNNHAAGDGGGIWNVSSLLIDASSVISNNTSGGNGGGLWHNALGADTAALSKVTLTGNTATGSGGAISVGNLSGGATLTMHFSRLAGNTAAAGRNLNNIDSVVTATNNWWGTNTPGGTISDITTIANFTPFIVLTHTASPNKIRINQSTTLTADMSKDNLGNGVALAGNLDVLNALPITFHNPILGTIPNLQPEALSAGAQATATFVAGNVGGNASADATVDQQTVTAPIIILQPPSIIKTFAPTSVAVNAPGTVTFSITNGNTVTINSSFTDTLPANLLVATIPNVVNGCGGTVTATAGSISFLNATLPVGTCSIAVNVQGSVDGVFDNSVTIASSDAGNGNTSSSTLTVINAPTIAKAFGAATIPLNGTTSLTLTLTSTNANLTLTGVAFNDALPPGLVVATPSNLNSTCNGTALSFIVNRGSNAAPAAPVPPGGSISLSGATLASGASCTVSANVTGSAVGVKNNIVQATSSNGGTGNISSASITVVGPPTVSKAFNPTSVALNASSTLSFTLTNPNTASALSGVAFTDNLPIGVVVAATPNITGSCGSGTITATAGSSTVTLSGGTLTASPAAGSSCTFSVSVTGTTPGTKSNTTGAITSTEGGTGATSNTFILTVEAPPAIAKVFAPATIALNGTTSLQFTITNPAANTAALTGVAFSDTLPVGLAVANASASVCGGTLTTTAPTGITLAGATIAVNSQCAFSVTVTGAASGSYTNTTGAVSSTNGGTGNTATANLTVAAPPTITKAFGAATTPLNGSTSLTFNLTNPNATVALTGIAFTDNLPAGIVVATPNGLTSTCGGSSTAAAGASSVSLATGTLASSASCSVSVNVTGTTPGVKNNSVQVASTEGGAGNTSNASITVVGPPVIIKAFGAASVPLNGSTSLTFTIQNNNTTTPLSGIGFTDTLPAGLAVSTPNGLTGTCGGGTITAAQATSVLSLTGATLAQSSSCTFSVNVTGTTGGTKNNTTGAVTSTEGGTGGTASASINVVSPPAIAKAFGAASVSLNGTTSLTFTLTNPAANAVAEAGVAFTDTLPAGIVVATPNGLTNTCGGTASATAGSGSISLTAGTIAASSNCTITVNVTGIISGSYTNTTGAVSSTNGGTGLTASANLTVAAPPTIVKSFSPASIPVSTSSTLTFIITNPNTTVPLTGVAFTDALPAGVFVSAAPVGTCGTGTVAAPIESGTITLAGGTLAAPPAPGSSCTFSVSVFAISAGAKINAVTVTSNEGGPGNTSNATLTVVAPPTFTKAFAPATVAVNGSSTLSFIITNPNASALSGIAFTDTLPAGVVVSATPAITGGCGSGTVTAAAGSGTISLSGGTLTASPLPGSTCTFSVSITATTPGNKNNTAGPITSTEGGTGARSNTALLTVVAPPSIAKAFGAANISLNGTTSLTFTITNPAANTVAQAGVAFTDTLPTGLVVSTPNGVTNTCGGTATATAGSGSISLTAGTIATDANCTITVNITATASGNYTNTTGTVSSTNGGAGNTATANISVAAPPTIAKAFGAATILLHASTSLTFTITNPNTSPLSGVAFTDNLPAGLVVSTPNGLAGSCGAGAITASSNSGSIVLSGGTLAASASCSFSVSVTGTAPGGLANTTGPVSSTESGPGAVSNTATVTILAPPSISKAFGAASIQLASSTSLTFTITNPNTTTGLTGVAVTDTLPAGLVVSTPNGLTGSCGTGVITAAATTITLTGGTIPASGACTFAANVTAIVGGTQVNTTSAVTSTNGSTGNTATATLIVLAPDLTISKTHIGNFKQGQTGALYTITVTNSGAAPTSGTVTVSDTLPASITATAFAGTGWTCTLTPLSCTRADILAIAGAYPPLTLTVNVSGVAPASATNTATVSGGGETNTANDTATDVTTIDVVPPDFSITAAPALVTVKSGLQADYTVTLTPLNNVPFSTAITLTAAGVPANTSILFQPATVTPGTTAATSSFLLRTSADDPFLARNIRGHSAPLLAVGMPLAGILFLGFGFRRKRWLNGKSPLLMLFLFLCMGFGLYGCASAGSSFRNIGTPPGTYTITVTGTAGAVMHSTTVTLTVTP